MRLERGQEILFLFPDIHALNALESSQTLAVNVYNHISHKNYLQLINYKINSNRYNVAYLTKTTKLVKEGTEITTEEGIKTAVE